VDLSTVSDAGRTERQLPATDFGSISCDRQTQSGTDAAVVKEIAGVGSEVGDIQNPAAVGNGNSELMLFVALPVTGGNHNCSCCKIARKDLQAFARSRAAHRF